MSTFRTFKEYIVFREGTTIGTTANTPYTQDTADPDEDTDQQLMADPTILDKQNSKNLNKDRMLVRQAIQIKKQHRELPLKGAITAAEIRAKLP